MKNLLLTTLILIMSHFAIAQGDCFGSATSINTCGYIFAGNNATYGDCPGNMCGCVGGSTNPSNLDDDCSTVYSGGNCGSDFQGSIENSMFWKFRPTESCDYQLCITADNCCCNQGAGSAFMQVWIGQQDTTTGLISAYHVNDNANTSITGGNTICYTFTVNQNDGDLIIMTDGNAGSECDIYLDMNQVNCSDTCPIAVIDPIMALRSLKFSVKNLVKGNSISWKADEYDTAYYNLERSKDSKQFSIIHSINSEKSEGVASYSYVDYSPYDGYNYYRLKEIGKDGDITYSKVIQSFNNYEDMYGPIKEYWTITGEKVDSVKTGIIIQVYENGKSKKVIKTK